MTQPLSIDRTRTALLVMDFQKLIVDGYVADSELLRRPPRRIPDRILQIIKLLCGKTPAVYHHPV